MKDGKLGESFVTVFLKRLVHVLVEPFSEMLWERKTLLLVCPKLLSQEDGLKEGQKLFRVVVTLFISSFVKFCCTEPSTRAEWPSAAVTPSFGSWALGLILCLNILFRRVRTGWDRDPFAGTCVCLWDQAQRHSCDSTEALRCREWDFSAGWYWGAVCFRCLLYL